MKRTLIPALCSAALMLWAAGVLFADTVPTDVTGPQITGFMLSPTNADQCTPVGVAFTLTNRTDATIQSQGPYSGVSYDQHESMLDKGIDQLGDARYMVAVSLDGGQDGYPYRWGFHTKLLPERSTTVSGYLSLTEPGTYRFSAVVVHNGQIMDAADAKTASVRISQCPDNVSQTEPAATEQVTPDLNGDEDYASYDQPAQDASLFDQMTQDGQAQVTVQPFYTELAPNTYYQEQALVVTRPGMELVLFPNGRDALLNGEAITLPPDNGYYGSGYTPNSGSGGGGYDSGYTAPFFGSNATVGPFGYGVYLGSEY